jgi:hypothetical protein
LATFVSTGKPFLDALEGVCARTYDQSQGVPWVVILTIVAIPPLVCLSGWMYPFVDLCFQVLIYLDLNGVYLFAFPRFSTQGGADFSGVMDIVRVIERTCSWN